LEILAGHGANQFISATLETDLPQPPSDRRRLLFLEHGTQKLFHFPPPDHRMGMHGLTPLMTVSAGVVGPLQSPKTTASLLLAKLSGLLTIRAGRN
jgi:hypothetical protein